MLHDRVLVSTEADVGERQTGGGLVIPATASMGKRLAWANVVETGQNVRQGQIGDRVLFDPEDRAGVERPRKGSVCPPRPRSPQPRPCTRLPPI